VLIIIIIARMDINQGSFKPVAEVYVGCFLVPNEGIDYCCGFCYTMNTAKKKVLFPMHNGHYFVSLISKKSLLIIKKCVNLPPNNFNNKIQ